MRLLWQARPGNQLKRKAGEAALAGQVCKAAKTDARLPMSPRKRLAVKRSETASKAAQPEAILQTTVKPGNSTAMPSGYCSSNTDENGGSW